MISVLGEQVLHQGLLDLVGLFHQHAGYLLALGRQLLSQDQALAQSELDVLGPLGNGLSTHAHSHTSLVSSTTC